MKKYSEREVYVFYILYPQFKYAIRDCFGGITIFREKPKFEKKELDGFKWSNVIREEGNYEILLAQDIFKEDINTCYLRDLSVLDKKIKKWLDYIK